MGAARLCGTVEFLQTNLTCMPANIVNPKSTASVSACTVCVHTSLASTCAKLPSLITQPQQTSQRPKLTRVAHAVTHHGKWGASKMHPTCHDVTITYMLHVPDRTCNVHLYTCIYM